MDSDRQEALELADRGQRRVMTALDVVGAELCTRLNAGMVLFAVSRDLGVLFGHCPDHGADLTTVALLDGRAVQLGHIDDAEELGRAIVSHPALDAGQAGRLLAGLQEARP